MAYRSSKPIAGTIVVAVVIVALALGAGWLYLRSSGALTKVTSLDRTVIVLASPGEDGTQLAGVVAVATEGGSKVEFLDPLKTVTIAGTSYDKLRDAYPFGGAAAVAAALGAKPRDGSGWVDVPQAVWMAALAATVDTQDASGTPGVMVTLPNSMDVFDGARLASFHEGTSTVPAADVGLLLQGSAYMPESARLVLAQQIGRAAVRAVGARARQDELRSDLSPEALTQLLSRLARP